MTPASLVTPLPVLAWCATQPRWLTAVGDTLVWTTGEADEPGGLFAIRGADLGRVAPRCLLDFAPWRDAGVVCPLGLAVHAGQACLVIGDAIVQVPLDGGAPTTVRRSWDAALLWSIGTWRGELYVSTYDTIQRERRSDSPVRWGIERVRDRLFERTHASIQPGDRPVPARGPRQPGGAGQPGWHAGPAQVGQHAGELWLTLAAAGDGMITVRGSTMPPHRPRQPVDETRYVGEQGSIVLRAVGGDGGRGGNPKALFERMPAGAVAHEIGSAGHPRPQGPP